jgi:hypothetical protein
MNKAYLPFDPDKPNEAVMAPNDVSDSVVTAWMKKYGSLKTPIIEMRVEYGEPSKSYTSVNQQTSDSTKRIIRIHVYDKNATPFAAGAKKTRDAAGASWEELRLDKRINFHMPGSGFVNNGAQLMSIWLCWRLLPAPIVDAQLPDPRPEHRLIKPPKKRPITRSDVVAWLAERIPGTGPLSRDDVARLILEARQNKNAISAIEQTTFLEAA